MCDTSSAFIKASTVRTTLNAKEGFVVKPCVAPAPENSRVLAMFFLIARSTTNDT